MVGEGLGYDGWFKGTDGRMSERIGGPEEEEEVAEMKGLVLRR